ncbi:MAG: hypothetical protein QOE37_462 [Microbacteriaceae bacterium]|nr:hypothetical protein [Microbacteriaceae bacterium]
MVSSARALLIVPLLPDGWSARLVQPAQALRRPPPVAATGVSGSDQSRRLLLDEARVLDTRVPPRLGRYRCLMTASASPGRPREGRSLAEGASPKTVRAALFPEDRELFDRAYASALDQARRTYEVTPILETIEEWRRRAVLQSDPEAFRRSVRRAAEFFTGEAVPEDEPLAVTRAKAGM